MIFLFVAFAILKVSVVEGNFYYTLWRKSCDLRRFCLELLTVTCLVYFRVIFSKLGSYDLILCHPAKQRDCGIKMIFLYIKHCNAPFHCFEQVQERITRQRAKSPV